MAETTTPIAPAADFVTVTVNGKEQQFPKGKNLLAALLDAGTYVPHYCWHPSLSISGNCRLCLVEIEGQPRPNVSCNMTCTEGLKIKTEGPMVEDCRKGMMEFLLVNHPLDCPICDRGGECMLQRYSMEYGTGTARTTDERRRFEKPQFDALVDIERNRCIMCTRCVRFMDEVAGDHLLGVFARGNRNYIGTFGNGPVDNIFSGNIIDICPVGCLTSKPYRFKARPWEMQQVASTCTLCSAGCPTTTWLRDGQVLRVTPPARKYLDGYTVDEDTKQFICNEGRFGNYYPNSGERMVKIARGRGEARTALDWPAALEAAAGALKKAAEAGPEKVAILAGGRATNEEYYLLSRLARAALGTNQIDWRLGLVSAEAAEMAGRALLASDGDLDQLAAKGYDATLLVGADLYQTEPVIGLKIKEAARLRNTKLLELACRSDAWLGEHAAASATVRPEALGATLAKFADALKAGAAPDAPELKSFVEALGAASRGLLVVPFDLAGGIFNGELLAGAMKLLKQLGAGWQFLPVLQARNAKGALAAGAQSDRLPGGSNLNGARATIAEFWGGLKAPAEKGASAPEILRRAAAGEIQTLLLFRADELVNHPERALIEKALEATPEVIVFDVFPSWITERATLVLPGAVYFETEGSLVSADGALQALLPASPPPGDAQEDWRILTSLLEALGVPVRARTASEIFAELLSCWGEPRFRLEDLRLEGPGEESPQRARSAFRRRARPAFKLQMSDRTEPSKGKPAAIGAGKLRLLWFNAIQGDDHLGSHADQFAALRPAAVLELSPADAAEHGLAEGDLVRIEGCSRPAALALNPGLAQGVAYGAANMLGLALGAPADGLPQIKISKAEGAN